MGLKASTMRKPVNNEVANNDYLELQLHRLNDDCLTHIISYLSLKDQLELMKTSQRFLDVYCSNFGSKFNEFKFEDIACMEQDYQVYFLKHVGPYIKTLELRNCYHYSDVISSGNFMPNLTKIHMRLHYMDPLCDDKLQAISTLTSLEILRIDNGHFKGKHLHKLHNLKELKLNRCGHMSYGYFNKLLHAAVRLRVLELISCNFQRGKLHLKRYAQNLEELVLKSPSVHLNFESISYLRKLKKLHVQIFDYDDYSKCLKALKAKNGGLLEDFEMTVPYDIDSNFDIIGYIENFRHLQSLFLNIEGSFSNDKLRKLGNLRVLKKLEIDFCDASYENWLELIRICETIEQIYIRFPFSIKVFELRRLVDNMLAEQNKQNGSKRTVSINGYNLHASEYTGNCWTNCKINCHKIKFQY